MDLVDIIESRRFLGGEFLVWLWYCCDVGRDRFDVPGIGPVTLSFDDQLVLEAFLAEAEQSRLTGGAPTQSPEAKTALRSGKRVSKAKLRLVVSDEREWVFTIRADDFTFSSVKVPMVLTRRDERLLERLSLLDDLTQMWEGLYRTFLEERLVPAWTKIEAEIGAWASAS